MNEELRKTAGLNKMKNEKLRKTAGLRDCRTVGLNQSEKLKVKSGNVSKAILDNIYNNRLCKFFTFHSPLFNFQRKAAFTLAEVLITLGIIGVVAAMTIPTLTKNYNKQVIETRLKQNYSLFQNAWNMAQAEYGDVNNLIKPCKNDDPSCNSVAFFDTYFFKYLKVVTKGKMTLADFGYKTPIYYTDGQTIFKDFDNLSTKYTLSNGSRVITVGRFGSKNTYASGYYLIVDLNGINRPNTLGKDIFIYYLILDGKHNFDVSNFNFSFDEDTMKYTITYYNHDELKEKCLDDYYYGLYCGYLLKENGWKFPKDYPIKF